MRVKRIVEGIKKEVEIGQTKTTKEVIELIVSKDFPNLREQAARYVEPIQDQERLKLVMQMILIAQTEQQVSNVLQLSQEVKG